MRPVNLFRAFVAHPSDTPTELQSCKRAANGVNNYLRTLDIPILVYLTDWTDTRPGFHPEGGQGQIEEMTPLDDFDLIIGLFKHRIGTPLKGGETGTEREIRRALEQLKQSKTPAVQAYFSNEPLFDFSVEALSQTSKLQEFKSKLQQTSLTREYRDINELEGLIRRFLLDETSKATQRTSSSNIMVSAQPFAPPQPSEGIPYRN